LLVIQFCKGDRLDALRPVLDLGHYPTIFSRIIFASAILSLMIDVRRGDG
jgi:hypothetical protein